MYLSLASKPQGDRNPPLHGLCGWLQKLLYVMSLRASVADPDKADAVTF